MQDHKPDQILSIRVYKEFIHYYLNDNYLGMLVIDKGELSDFRAIIRKNKMSIPEQSISERLTYCLYELLNNYLYEHDYIEKEKIQAQKMHIVKSSASIIKKAGIEAVTIGFNRD